MVYNDLLQQPIEINQRTGIGVKALPGIMYRTDLEKEGFPLLSLRRIPFNFVPEIMWFLSGSKNAEWLSKHTKIWDSFKDEDGTISSAYGYRWREHFGLDQLQIVIDKLRHDPSTRHGVIMMWDPYEDSLKKQKNVPCPYTFTLNIIQKRLHLHLTIRSNDMVLGFPTDVAGFALLLEMIAQHLNVRTGVLSVAISNCHIYENQIEAVETMLTRWKGGVLRPYLNLPENSFVHACALNDFMVKEIKDGIKNYQPYESIKNIPIAL